MEWEYLDGGELSLFEVYKSIVEMGFQVMSNLDREQADGFPRVSVELSKVFYANRLAKQRNCYNLILFGIGVWWTLSMRSVIRSR